MIAYFETSALVKLLIQEQDTQEARATWDEAALQATSRLTYPEARAALASAARAGRLTRAGLRAAKEELETRWAQLLVIEAGEGVARAAGDLSERHALRGYDAVHLASALEATEGGQLLFVCWDRGLGRAAVDSGLAVAPLLTAME
ncbi:MAG: type II toxin-antitoxin system VapC family toxin [Actinobacteria bacterium]|nr:type II toxin-antitoxin system VapC family toxin [Actinomycetota bacterium]